MQATILIIHIIPRKKGASGHHHRPWLKKQEMYLFIPAKKAKGKAQESICSYIAKKHTRTNTCVIELLHYRQLVEIHRSIVKQDPYSLDQIPSTNSILVIQITR